MIAESITALTDYAIALQTFLLALLLLRFKHVERLWAAAFTCVCLASLLGGVYHGLGYTLTLTTRHLLWNLLTGALGGASFFMVVATAQATIGRNLRWAVFVLAIGKLLVYLQAIPAQDDFTYIVVDYLLAMLLVLILQLGWGLRRGQPGSIWIVTGVGISAIAAVLLAFPWPGIAMFRPVDIYHLVQMVALSCFFLGVWLNV